MVDIVIGDKTFHDLDNASKETFMEVLGLITDEVTKLNNVDTSQMSLDEQFNHLEKHQALIHQLGLLDMVRASRFPVKHFF